MMKIVIEVSEGIIQQVISTGKTKVSIIDHDAVENADSIEEIENNFYTYNNKTIKTKKEIKELIAEERFKATDDFLNRCGAFSHNKKCKDWGHIDECNNCGKSYESYYLHAKCPHCGEININCNLCSMENCAGCKNGSNFDGE